jgi:uncharacterized protein (DUF2236 family)
MQLGPASLLWRWAGDNRLAFAGLPTGILQLMHPGLGAGVAEHSAFFTEPWERISRSMPEIIGVVYDADGEATGRRIRGYHQSIKGTDHRGRPYSALRPETFWWAHATFQFAVEQVVDRFDAHRLSYAERRQLYVEGLEWYRRYGVSFRAVPPDRDAFQLQWDRYCDEVLEMTPAAERAVDMALHEKVDRLPDLPSWSRPACESASASRSASRSRRSSRPWSSPCARAGGSCPGRCGGPLVLPPGGSACGAPSPPPSPPDRAGPTVQACTPRGGRGR